MNTAHSFHTHTQTQAQPQLQIEPTPPPLQSLPHPNIINSSHFQSPPVILSTLPVSSVIQQLRSAQEQAFLQQQQAQALAFQHQQQTLTNLEIDHMLSLVEQTAQGVQDIRHHLNF